MVGSSRQVYLLLYILSLLIIFHFNFSSSSLKPLCRSEDLSTLLQFKDSFNTACDDPISTSKLNSWIHGEVADDCCSWAGVECDKKSGYVTGLDLSNSCLHGALNSSNSIFHLLHLEKLNLAFNDFNHSQIPSRFSNLSLLTYLNLSSASFSGQVPPEISMLSRLASLDLSSNFDVFGRNLLQLSRTNLISLIQNMTRLEYLHLSHVNLSSKVPKVLANSSSLVSLQLSDCDLFDEFPIETFQLPNLQVLNLSQNQGFSGQLPASIGNMKSLETLDINSCNFSGLIPYSLCNLSNLVFLDFGANSFEGQIPFSLGNLKNLNHLSLHDNNFTSSDNLSWIKSLKNLRFLHLRKINFQGDFPYLGSFNMLSCVDIGDNQLIGEIPHWLRNLTQLKVLNLGLNNLHGSIPVFFSELKHLQYLNLGRNNFSGSVLFDMFLELKNLKWLSLQLNNLSVITTNVKNSTSLPHFVGLGLGHCNLVEFPEFLRYQKELKYVDLSVNSIHGHIPRWIWNMSTETLEYLDVSYNFLTGFIETPTILLWSSLRILNLSSNMLQGSVPIPAFPILFYSISNNLLTGSLPFQICELSLVQVVDLSNNHLSGRIPECLSNLSNSLSILNLQRNSFSGSVPSRWTKENKLRMIDLSQNNLEGPLPRSFANCKMLEILNLGQNKLNDTFPFWLGTLSELKILNLQSNQFHGKVGNCLSNITFKKLQIIDLSLNSFVGDLPFDCLGSWNAMKAVNLKDIGYLQTDTSIQMGGSLRPDQYCYSMTINNKGTNRKYTKIQEVFTAIDFSGNRFHGVIPELIGTLKGLQALNLSNNVISGSIPSSISQLALLESLDLSQNQLTGQIPRELTQLTFLGTINVANNNLTGPIPHGSQFDTYPNSSFDGNTGLCGKPLSVKCIESKSNPARTIDSEGGLDIGWQAIITGYGIGIVIGIVIGQCITTRQNERFLKTITRSRS